MRNPEVEMLLKLQQEIASLKHDNTYYMNALRGHPRTGGTLYQRLASWFIRCHMDRKDWWRYIYAPSQQARAAQVFQEIGGWLFSTSIVAAAAFRGDAFDTWDMGNTEDFMKHLESQRRAGIVFTWFKAGMSLSASATNASTWRGDGVYAQGTTDFVTVTGSLREPDHTPNVITGAVSDKYDPLDPQ